MRSIELFTGAGGLALGIHLAGFEHRLLVEADNDACETLLHNSRNETVPGISRWPIVHGGVESVVLSSHHSIDLLAAGIPCQPFSNGGKRCGIEDDRNMFPVFAQALAALRPKAFLLENVNGLVNGKLTSHMEHIILQLRRPRSSTRHEEPWKGHSEELRSTSAIGTADETNYKVSFHVLNAADYGVPQIRKRVFIIGFRSDLEASWSVPEATHSREVGSSNGTKAWLTVHDAIKSLPEIGTEGAATMQHVITSGARSYKGHTGSVLDQPAKSLKAGTHGVGGGENMLRHRNGDVRYFTARECARLQTFPDSWVFKGARSSITRQIGNAVPVQMATLVAASIREALNSSAEPVSG